MVFVSNGLYLYLCFSFFYGYVVTREYQIGKPKIYSSTNVINVNGNHTLSCEGNKPLKWTTPKINNNNWTVFDITHSKPCVNKRCKSSLKIFNITHHFVGYYYCYYNATFGDDHNGSDSYYLYVNDTRNLFVEPSNSLIVVVEDQTATIPCKPTSPDVIVSLATEINGMNTTLTPRHDPREGYVINGTEKYGEGEYFCEFKKIVNGKVFTSSYEFTYVVEEKTNDILSPALIDLKNNHTIESMNVTLQCEMERPSIRAHMGEFTWVTPSGQKIHGNMRYAHRKKISKNKYYIQSQYSRISSTNDSGIYYCRIKDYQNHSASLNISVKVYGKDENVINISTANNYTVVELARGQYVTLTAKVFSHPLPTISWFNNANRAILDSDRKKYIMKDKNMTLTIKDPVFEDTGYYTISVSNGYRTKMKKIYLDVTGAPHISFETQNDLILPVGKPCKIKCIVKANPLPNIELRHKNCQTEKCNFKLVKADIKKKGNFTYELEGTVTHTTPGMIDCFAKNSVNGTRSKQKKFYVSDVKDGLDIFVNDSTVYMNRENMIATVARGESIRVSCGASKYIYKNITWYFNHMLLDANVNRTFTWQTTKYSDILHMNIHPFRDADVGKYRCQVTNKNETSVDRIISIRTASPEKPQIFDNVAGQKVALNLPNKLTLFCNASGLPKPSITWYKDGGMISPAKSERIRFLDDYKTLVIEVTEEKDEGTYKCEACNKMGNVSVQRLVKFKNLPVNYKWLVVIIVFLSLLFLAAIVFLVLRIRQERALQRELEKLGLSNFVKGAVENLNPEIGIDDQAELLPYDKAWEVPIENITLGKQLGSGAFGVVMKAEAKNVIEDEKVSVVAVKMVKKNTNDMYIKALASELKIMVHLGKHLNIVNLLGACTKNVAKRELFVIVEYCRFGNLQNYLLRHRDFFVNQIDPITGNLDYEIDEENLHRSYSLSSNKNSVHTPLLRSSESSFSADYRECNETVETVLTTIPEGESVVTSNGSSQPGWRSNYKGDYKGDIRPIYTKDLLVWSFQVARGMEYLVSRKVLHGDLAARNILLTDNNIVKICDFGLAKNMYNNSNYKKSGNNPLPLKWMAIESIEERIFSTQSDVWSFGVVLWEFFSLGKTPYPGIEANEELYKKLQDGYRMESPKYAPKQVYDMMTSCWAAKPRSRPSFTNLSEKIGLLLDESSRARYIDLNDPYLHLNSKRLGEGHSDYLAMLNSPTFESLSSPNYVNGYVAQDMEDGGYTSMGSVFSPRPTEGQVFVFNIIDKNSKNCKDGDAMELTSMLSKSPSADSGLSPGSPTSPNSFSNPNYHILPHAKECLENNATTDNYISMSKSIVQTDEKKNSTSTPEDVSDLKWSHYVNGTINWDTSVA